MSGLKLPLSPESWAVLRQYPNFYQSLAEQAAGVGLVVRLEDAEAHTRFEKTAEGQPWLTLSIPLDDDSRGDNGRLYIRDEFIFDSSGKQVLHWNREIQNSHSDRPDLDHWKKIQDSLKQIKGPSPLYARDLAGNLWETLARPSIGNATLWEAIISSKTNINYLTQIGRAGQKLDPYLQLQALALESYYNRQDQGATLDYLQRWVLDQDRNSGNGRWVVEDRFRTDPANGELLGVERRLYSSAKAWGDPGNSPSGETPSIAQPDFEAAKQYFSSIRESLSAPLSLSRLKYRSGRLSEEKDLFASLNTSDRQYLQDLVFAARVANPYLMLRSQDPANRWEVQQLGNRLEVTFTWLLSDYQDEQKNQVLCRDRFLIGAKDHRVVKHERFFEPRIKTWEDRSPSLHSAFEEVSGVSEEAPIGAQGFVKRSAAHFMEWPTERFQERLNQYSGPRELEISEGGLPGRLSEGITEGIGKGSQGLKKENLNLMAQYFEGLIREQVTDSKGWSPWATRVDEGELRQTYAQILTRWEHELSSHPRQTFKSAFEKIPLSNLSTKVQEIYREIGQDPMARELMASLGETDFRLRDRELLKLAREKFLKGPHQAELALALIQSVNQRGTYPAEAGNLLAFFNGGGSTGLQLELLGKQFVDHVFDESMILAMMGAGWLGSAAEYQGLVALARLGRPGQIMATGLGIGGEALAFSSLSGTVRSFSTDPAQVFAHFPQEVMSAGVLFSLFRMGHGLMGHLGNRLARTPLARPSGKLVQDLAPSLRPLGTPRVELRPTVRGLLSGAHFLWGVEAMYLSGAISRKLGWAPPTQATGLQLQIRALSDYLGAMLGYRLANGISGGRLNQGIVEMRMRSDLFRQQRGKAKPVDQKKPDLSDSKSAKPQVESLKSHQEEKIPEEIELPPEPSLEPVEPLREGMNESKKPKVENFENIFSEAIKQEPAKIRPVPLAYNRKAAKNNLLLGEMGEAGVPMVEQEFPGLGRWRGITEEGVSTGKRDQGHQNEDGLAWVQSPGGSLYLLNFDGIGGHAGGKKATEIAAEHMVKGLGTGQGLAKSILGANEAIRNFNPESGTVFGAVRLRPSLKPENGLEAEFFWAGDIRLMVARKDAQGNYQWIYRNVEESPAVKLTDAAIKPDSELYQDRSMIIGTHSLKRVVENNLGISNLSYRITEEGMLPDPRQHYRSAKGHSHINLKDGDLVLTFSDGVTDNILRTQEVLDYFNRHSLPEQALQETHAESRYKMEVYSDLFKNGRLNTPEPAPFVYHGFVPEWQGQTLFMNSDGHILMHPTHSRPLTLAKPDNISLSVFEVQLPHGKKFTPSSSKGDARPQRSKTPLMGSGHLGDNPFIQNSAPREVSKIPELPSFPEGTMPKTLRVGKINVEAAQQEALSLLRAKVLEELAQPSKWQLRPRGEGEKLSLELRLFLDTATGAFVKEAGRDTLSINIPIEILPKQNRMQIPQAFRDQIYEYRVGVSSPQVRASLEALENLTWTWLRPKIPTSGPTQELPKSMLEVLPESRPEILTHNLMTLKSVQKILMDQDPAQIVQWPYVSYFGEYQVGEIFLDGTGKVVAGELFSAPPEISRTKPYRFGEPSENSTKVPVILNGDTVIWTTRMKDMNPRQTSELLALTEGAAKIQKQDPFAINVIRGTHEGPLVRDMAQILNEFHHAGAQGPTSFQIHLVKHQGIYRAYSTVVAGTLTRNLKAEFGHLPAWGHVSVQLQGAVEGGRPLHHFTFMADGGGLGPKKMAQILRFFTGQSTPQSVPKK